MPLQNRVTPTNQIIATPGRGLFMGNRGCLHDTDQRIVRQYAIQRWIICATEFRGRKRQLMAPKNYTELFFLDEATALAAGHRPCAECRHDAYSRFKNAWMAGNPDSAPTSKLSVSKIDNRLHQSRLTERLEQRTHLSHLGSLPAGVFVYIAGFTDPFLWWCGKLHRWSNEMRYYPGPTAVRDEEVMVLTPEPTVNALRAGFVPDVSVSVLSDCRPIR